MTPFHLSSPILITFPGTRTTVSPMIWCVVSCEFNLRPRVDATVILVDGDDRTFGTFISALGLYVVLLMLNYFRCLQWTN